MEKKVTFFMLVTKRDIFIADYAIKSYEMLDKKYKKDISFTLDVYCNCLPEELKQIYFPRWSRYPFVRLTDNSSFINVGNLIPGEKVTSPEGILTIREGNYEHCDEIWTTELKKIKTPYFATVDADFEILNPDFIYEMLQRLEADPKLVGISTDFMHTRENIYDSFTQKYMTLHERWHTWFCLYKQQANECPTSHFFFEEERDGKKFTYDSSGYFQRRLILDFGCTFETVDKKYQPQFIHYGAFSKNRSINEKNVAKYRRLAILAKRGLSIFHSIGLGDTLPNKAIRFISRQLFHKNFNIKERQTFAFD